MKIVLESDGTEVDEEEFFSTLEQYTCFMILKEGEDWAPPPNAAAANQSIQVYWL